MSKSGVEYLAQHPGWKTRKRQHLVVFIEGGLVQAVCDLNASRPTRGVSYEVMDYDVLDGNGPKDIQEYFERRSAKLKAYMKRYLPSEWKTFQERMGA